MSNRLAMWSCLVALFVVAGCATGGGGVSGNQKQVCNIGLIVNPSTGTADHAAQPPDNEVRFVAFLGPLPGSTCTPPTAVLQNAVWTTSDPLDVSIDNTVGNTNGTATCVHSTSQPATITATYTPPGESVETATASISCQ